MAYQTLADYGGLSEGVHVLFLYVNSVTNGVFIVMFLFSLYIMMLLGSYFAQKNISGTGDFPQSMAVSGFILVVVAGLLRLAGEGIVSLPTLAVCLVVFLIGLAVLFLDKDRGI